MEEGNNIDNNQQVQDPVLVPFEDNERSLEERYRLLLDINGGLENRLKELELINENMQLLLSNTVIQLDHSKNEAKEFKKRYIDRLQRPIKVILNDDVFWLKNEYSDELFYKYKNKEHEGGALLKFKHGESNINESGEELNSFKHKFSFGEIVTLQSSKEHHQSGRLEGLEGIVVFETKHEVELLTNDKYVELSTDFFITKKKETVKPLDRRVIAFEYFHLCQMSYLSTKNRFN